jgi:hypothetical protein
MGMFAHQPPTTEPGRTRNARLGRRQLGRLTRSGGARGLCDADADQHRNAADELVGLQTLAQHDPGDTGRDDRLDHADDPDVGGRQVDQGGRDEQV